MCTSDMVWFEQFIEELGVVDTAGTVWRESVCARVRVFVCVGSLVLRF